MKLIVLRSISPLLLASPLLGAWAGPLGVQDSLAERRDRAEELAEKARPEDLREVLSLLSDPDAGARQSLVAYLSAVELESLEDGLERLSVLRSLATEDVSGYVRRAALESLADEQSGDAARTLFGLLGELHSSERVHGAKLFSDRLYLRSEVARQLLEQAVLESFGEQGGVLPADVLAVFLRAYGKRLAEREGGGELARERAPIVLGLTDPDPMLRRAAEESLELFLARLRELERHDRADRALTQFAEDGVSTRPLLYLRVIRALEEGGISPEMPLAWARQLERSSPSEDAFGRGNWRARSTMLQANALLALDRPEEARELLERAADLLDGLIARHFERSGERGAMRQRDLLIDRAMVEFTEVFRCLAAGKAADDLALLHQLRAAHSLLLEAQLVAQAADVASVSNFDPFFSASLSPSRLVFAARHHEAWPASRCLEQKRAIGRALASISRREMPGYEPFPELLPEIADPVVDPRRSRLLARLAQGEFLSLKREFDDLRMKQLRRIDSDPELESQLTMVSFAMHRVSTDLREKSLEERFFGLRQPSADALQLAELLRREDRNVECRQLAEAFGDAIEEEGLRQHYSWAVHLSAQAQLLIGGSWSDEGDAKKAEEHMQRSLDFLEGLRSHFEERGARAAADAVDAEISENLVSLAVNSNVKARDPEAALAYFERAYALRQDDFMRIMLACYRARSGRDEEARELIADVPESPRGYYNLACTFALLGERERALELLEADFLENRSSPGALEKQKEWARSDPDLASLREDPRFQLLTEPVIEEEDE